MRALAVVTAALAVAVLWTSYGTSANPCPAGSVRGFAFVRGDVRLGGVGAIPSEVFVGDHRYFGIRFNCKRKSVLVRRLDVGVYDILFPNNPAQTVSVTAANGIVTAAQFLGNGAFRVQIRSPQIDNNILQFRESAFFVAVF